MDYTLQPLIPSKEPVHRRSQKFNFWLLTGFLISPFEKEKDTHSSKRRRLDTLSLHRKRAFISLSIQPKSSSKSPICDFFNFWSRDKSRDQSGKRGLWYLHLGKISSWSNECSRRYGRSALNCLLISQLRRKLKERKRFARFSSFQEDKKCRVLNTDYAKCCNKVVKSRSKIEAEADYGSTIRFEMSALGQGKPAKTTVRSTFSFKNCSGDTRVGKQE